MVLKTLVLPACAVLLALTGVAIAEEDRAQHFLGLDLSTAVLSPKPLGPPAKFVPLRLEAPSSIISIPAASNAVISLTSESTLPRTMVSLASIR